MAANQRLKFRRDHREERLFDGGEAQWAERRKVNAVIGLAEGYGRVYYRKGGLSNRELNLRQIGDRRTSRVLFGDDDGDLVDLKCVSYGRQCGQNTPQVHLCYVEQFI